MQDEYLKRFENLVEIGSGKLKRILWCSIQSLRQMHRATCSYKKNKNKALQRGNTTNNTTRNFIFKRAQPSEHSKAT